MNWGALARLRQHVARTMAGELDEVEVLRARSLEAALRRPLVEVILALQAQGCALALGRTPREILTKLERRRPMVQRLDPRPELREARRSVGRDNPEQSEALPHQDRGGHPPAGPHAGVRCARCRRRGRG
jgi:hypothetical protein